MASRTVYGREPTEKQHKYLHSLFFKLGGKDHMSVQVDEATVRQFIEIISAHAAQVINGAGSNPACCSCAASTRSTTRASCRAGSRSAMSSIW